MGIDDSPGKSEAFVFCLHRSKFTKKDGRSAPVIIMRPLILQAENKISGINFVSIACPEFEIARGRKQLLPVQKGPAFDLRIPPFPYPGFDF